MSEPRLISPMLDNFAMGEAMSNHHGVQCCPAMENNSDEKYIVKIISIPASQVQLEALLLTGAYTSDAAALSYFKELADGVADEAKMLQKLSKLEGFLSYDKWQIVPMENAVGYDVYLIGSYKRSLERLYRKHNMTQLAAVNLGLDLCAATAVCRRMGMLYVDLKPENVFVSEDNEYRIGDLGFAALSTLKYASLPERYISAYTPPEIKDAFSSLNETMDTYAIGLILYQAYNNGHLPFTGRAPETALPAPMYADYEMAEIILKACAPDPKDRWEDPIAMGQALVSYMQRNGANDEPIVKTAETENTPEIKDEIITAGQSSETVAHKMEESAEPSLPETEAKAEEAENIPEQENAESEEETAEELTEEEPEGSAEEQEESKESNQTAEVKETSEDTAAADAVNAEPIQLTIDDIMAEETSAQQEDVQETPDALVDDAQIVSEPEESPEVNNDEQPSEDKGNHDSEPTGSTEGNDEDAADLSFMDELVSDETAPELGETLDVDYEGISDDVSDILAQADELLAHDAPAPVVQPEAIPVELPAEEESESSDVSADVAEESAEEQTAETEETAEEAEQPAAAKSSGGKKLLRTVAGVLLAGALAFSGYYYYENEYIQTIDQLNVQGFDNQMTVNVLTDADESQLTVVCTDAYGEKMTASVVDGKAEFKDLRSNTIYSVSIEMEGLHKLIGNTSESYTTPAQTEIVKMDAKIGSEAGTVIVRFTVTGREPESWMLTCTAEGEEDKVLTFTDHMITVTDLTPDKVYQFKLDSQDSVFITGKTELEYKVMTPVYAENLRIVSCDENGLQVQWNTPSDMEGISWVVRCYNDSGYDKSLTTSENTAQFEGVEPDSEYTVEVIAEGMSTGSRTHMSEYASRILNFAADTSDPGRINLSWEVEGKQPDEGWLVVYTINNSQHQEVVKAEHNELQLQPAVPGVTYHFMIQSGDGATVFDGNYDVTTPTANPFSNYQVTADDFLLEMCRTPFEGDWSYLDISDNDFTTEFKVGEKASFLMGLPVQYAISDDAITTLFLIQDAEGNVISTNSDTRIWRHMWYQGRCELDVPQLPEVPGEYTVTIYFNGAYAAQQVFTVTAAE